MDRKPLITSVLVVGIGNRFRGDDAAGPATADAIRSRAPHGARVIEHSGEGASLMETWQSDDTVFLIDAAESDGEIGFVHEFDAHGRPVPADFFRYSTHAFSVAEAIELARVLGRLPARLYVFAIEGRDFRAGHAMSSEVAQAVETVTDRVLARIRDLTTDGPTERISCTSSVS